MSVPSTGKVMTVLGPVEPSELGHTQTHEHLLSDLSPILLPHGRRADSGALDDTDEHVAIREIPASVRERMQEPIRLDNYDWIRRNVYNWDNLRMVDERDAVEELSLYRAAGGGAVVESTSIGLGRDPAGLARISRSTGVHVIMGAGYYVRDFHPVGLDARSEATIADEIVADVVEGVADTGVKAGIIGEIGTSWPLHPIEERVLRAVCVAQQVTGAALQIHPGRNAAAAMAVMRVVQEAGGNPERVIVAHVERTLTRLEDMVELAQSGCYLEFDLFGQESSYYVAAPIDRPNDARRIDLLSALMDAGFGSRLLVSQDICQKVYLRKYGGPGYAHILENVIPVMRRKGWTDEILELVMRKNPREVLTLV